MIEKLKKIFPTLITTEDTDDIHDPSYSWFQTEAGDAFAIHADDLSRREKDLLKTFAFPMDVGHPSLTTTEEEWADFLFKGKASRELMNETHRPLRFLFFSLKEPVADPVSFKEAIHGFFPEPVPVLWENQLEGVIIESTEEENDLPFYFDIAEVLMSDFYIKIDLAVSSPIDHIKKARQEYKWLKKWAEIAKKYSASQVIDYRQAAPYLFLDQTDKETSSQIIDMVLKDTIEDPDLLKTIETFLECNSNATMAAKRLYMHRNSLQYRVDKFIERTGIDVKQFEGAISVYLALGLLKKS